MESPSMPTILAQSPQKPIRFEPGQRVRISYDQSKRVFHGTVVAHRGWRPLNGDNEWEVDIDGVGVNVAGDSEMFAVPSAASLIVDNSVLDAKYQDGFKHLKVGEVCPPCPACNGEMVPWDAWLVTGATCKSCGWNMSEGSGCLL